MLLPALELAELVRNGTLVPFIGSGASIGAPLSSNASLALPSASELAHTLAERFGLSRDVVNVGNLFDVTSAAAVLASRHRVEAHLQKVFGEAAEPKPFHRWLARQTSLRLIVTTNYDALIEDSLTEAGRDFHLVMIPSAVDRKGQFLWWPPGTMQPELVRGNELAVDPADVPVVLKMHGGLTPGRAWQNSVTTEEDYFDVACQVCDGSFLPPVVRKIFSSSIKLFVGYSLRDVHVRRLLHQLHDYYSGDHDRKDFVINKTIAELDAARFSKRRFETFEMSADEFAEAIDRAIELIMPQRPHWIDSGRA